MCRLESSEIRVELEISEGEMLYLPCGWFHEVSSVGEHAAINYWYHPPDGRAYDAPYAARSFWEKEWKRISATTRRARERAARP